MAVLIDPPAWPAHGRLWAHLASDTSLEELHGFAARLGLHRRSFERDHYDVPAEMYDALITAGAAPVTARDVVRRLTASGLRRRKADVPAPRRAGRELLRPPRLQAGDLVAVTATAGVVSQPRLAAGVARLESWGLRVQVAPHTLDTHEELGYLAGSDEERAGDLTAAWMSPDVSAILVARGGYGTQRTIDLVDWLYLAEAAPKVLVGFSDVTALHQTVASCLGVVSVHGHVATSLGAAEIHSAEALRTLLMEPELAIELVTGRETQTLVPGRATGVTVGGNLAVLASDLGTATSRPADGGIVILEDVDEPAYRIDRQLTQLVRSGWFAGVRGIVLGAFTRCGDPRQTAAALRHRLVPLGVPIISGVDVGHTSSTLAMPLGVRATLDADARRLTLERPALE